MQRGSGSESTSVRDPWHHGEAIHAFLRKTGYDYTRFNYLREWQASCLMGAKCSNKNITKSSFYDVWL
ncbi:conserved hypothetical protein [Methylorubrum extorquens CM4]|uniref:Uncharacterized protein n=1 Tax=Methylorubrum extorquens (strain CM4 / NCIMB 13688) TaxID=440085 RepID=B7L1D7_METC4|nr:conserved hypothetical protein [Methylorubrum extorquens CM4]